MAISSSWNQGDSQRAIPQIQRELELLRRQRDDMQRQQYQEQQQIQQKLKVAQDRRDYDSVNKMQKATYEFSDRWNRAFHDLDKRVQELNQDMTMAQQNLDRIEQQTDGSWILYQQGGASLQADMLFSTIPLTVLTRLIHPVAPATVMQAVEALRFRAMVLHYVILETDQFTPFDAHYFPQKDLIFSRLSEPKNYRSAVEPVGRTGLCLEIPCDPNDSIWNQTEDEITEHVLADLHKAGLPVHCRVITGFSKRLPFIYPIYDLAFADHLQTLEDHLNRLPRLIRLGRQGLFVHDNTHHTIEMAYKASQCLDDDGRWSGEQWQRHLESFAQNVVED